MINKIVVIFSLVMTLFVSVCFADIERRRDQFGKDFAYYIYPIAGEVPGLGTAAGFGASVLNIAGTDTDFTGYYINGDFSAKGAALLDYQIKPKRLVFDVGYNDYLVAPVVYERGILSDPDNVIYPKAEGNYLLSQLTLTFDQRRYEAYARYFVGRERLNEVLDKDGNAYEGVDKDWYYHHPISLGFTMDLTDDRLDPRKGTRFEFSTRLPSNNAADQSEYFVNDYNLSEYIPFRRWDTLALNLFYSQSLVTRKGETDFSTLQGTSGLNCNQYPPGNQRDECIDTETRLLNNVIANNRYGTASPLGGTQRLRSFDNYRFYASQVLFYGIEYRWNLTDERTPFDIYIARGIRTGIQLSAFWEQGMVADDQDELLDHARTSYGAGFRVILSGVVLRFDVANGSEGFQSQLFITYPWSMFSVDNPS